MFIYREIHDKIKKEAVSIHPAERLPEMQVDFMFEGKKYVYEVYKTRSFSKAAANLYISQPSLSATIKKIEARLGTPIFDRSTSPIMLTECGEKYIHYVEHLMDMENEFENYLNDFEALRTGHLSVGGSNLFASYVLPPLLSGFMGKYPSIEVKMTESTTGDLEKQLFSGSLDLVIDNYPFSDTIYDRHFFCKEQLLLAVPAELAREKGPDTCCLDAASIKNGSYEECCVCPDILQHFAHDPFLLLRAGNDTRERSDLLLKSAGLAPHVPLKLDQQVTAYHLACYGMGIAFVTDTLIRHVPDDSRIVFYKLPPDISQRNIYFYHKRSRYVTRAMEEFLKIAGSGIPTGQ